jgi:outer membrane protein OmpA-like peptidoglycan-associated protein
MPGVLVAAFLLLAGALALRPPDNALVLLPEADGTVGQVTFTRPGESVALSEAGTGVVLDGAVSGAKVRTFSPEEIDRLFGDALAAAPPGPASYLLYFDLGRSGVGRDTEDTINAILRDIVRRDVARIAVIGHTDRVGSAPANVALALTRATFVRDILVAGGVPPETISLRSHGEGDPLVPTADGVANAENRRVEVMVR